MSAIDPSVIGQQIVPDGGGGGDPPAGTGIVEVTSGAWVDPARSAATVIGDLFASMIGSETSGTAIVSDGVGDIRLARVASYQSEYDFSSSDGFTTDNGAGGNSAAITSGVARLVCAAGTSLRAGGVYNGPSIRRALDEPCDTIDVAVRIASMSAGAVTQATLEISDAATGGNRIAAIVDQTGRFYFYDQTTSAIIANIAGAFASFTGEEWLRLRVVGGVVRALYGVGVGGALPTSWTLGLDTQSVLYTGRMWGYVTLGMVCVGTLGSETIDMDDLTIAQSPPFGIV